MASRPLLRKLSKRIEQLGGDDVIFDMVAGGVIYEEIAERFRGMLPDRPKFPSRTMIYRWIWDGGEERDKKWEKAKKLRSHSLVEDGFDLLEDDAEAPVTSADASRLRQRVEYRKWLAGTYNRKDYGEEKAGVDVNLSIGNLHLDALRSAGRMGEIEDGEGPKVIEAEIVDEDESDVARPRVLADPETGDGEASVGYDSWGR